MYKRVNIYHGNPLVGKPTLKIYIFIDLIQAQEMRYTSTLNLAEEKKNLIKNVNDKAITQYTEILP
jgi:hypothetical protein